MRATDSHYVCPRHNSIAYATAQVDGESAMHGSRCILHVSACNMMVEVTLLTNMDAVGIADVDDREFGWMRMARYAL